MAAAGIRGGGTVVGMRVEDVRAGRTPGSADAGDAGPVLTEATLDDVADIAALAAVRREAYEAAQPQFWRRASDAVDKHVPWLRTQVEDPDVVALVVRSAGSLGGFVFASVVGAPPVYDPGGPSGVVDDFAVADPSLWPTVGRDLLAEVKQRLLARGVAQVVVVCGHHDEAKRAALLAAGLTVASEWLVGPLTE
jgi:hypothetical protein